MIKNIASTLASKPGIICVRVQDLNSKEDFCGGEMDERQRKVLRSLITLSEENGNHREAVRLVLGDGETSRSAYVYTDGVVVIAVVIKTGDAIAKSLKRMVGRVMVSAGRGKLAA